MTDSTNLLDLLDAVDAAEEREAIYASCTSPLSPQDVYEASQAGRPSADWLLFRFEVGPPGVPLPPRPQALESILSGQGTVLDAYALVHTGRDLPASPDLLPVIYNAALGALSSNARGFSHWLAARACFAAVAWGEPERAWFLLDALTRDGERSPQLDKLAVLEPIRGHRDLEHSIWVRRAIWWLWPHLRVPTIPAIAFPEGPEDPPGNTMDRLLEVGAEKLGRLVEDMLTSFREHLYLERAAEPLVQDLERRALVDGEPPELAALPDWFEDWAPVLLQTGQIGMARLAGLLLAAHGHTDGERVAALVMFAARASDLPVLRPAFVEVGEPDLVDDLLAAAEVLPTDVADALVAAMVPGHQRHVASMRVLAGALDLLGRLPGRPGSPLEVVVKQVETLVADRDRDHSHVGPAAEALGAQVHAATQALGDQRLVTPEEVERAVQAVPAPPVSTGLLELSQRLVTSPLDKLVLSLVLDRAVTGTHHQAFWRHGLLAVACDALHQLGAPRLLGLRLRLLDELLAMDATQNHRASLHFQRANTRWAIGEQDAEGLALVLMDAQRAAHEARRHGDLETAVDAASLMGLVAAEMQASTEAGDDSGLRTAALEQIEGLLSMGLPAEHRAILLQAKARLCRTRSPATAAELLDEAVPLLPPGDPRRWELQSEQVGALVDAGRVDDAVRLGRALIGQTYDEMSDATRVLVHSAVGSAHMAASEASEARRHFDQALDRTRGASTRNEGVVRLGLARCALMLRDAEQWKRQLAALSDPAGGFGSIVQNELARLAVTAAEVGLLQPDTALRLIDAALEAVSELGPTPVLQLERGRLLLDSGGDVDLAPLLRSALPHAAFPEVRGLVWELACNFGDRLDAETLTQVLESARLHGAPSVVARMLDRLGKRTEALQALRGSLAGPLSPGERLSCVHLLVTLLPEEEADERRKRCDELESLLEDMDDHPLARLDLASALRLLADGDQVLLHRARRHAERALARLNRPQHLAHGHRVLGHILAEIIRAAMPAINLDTVEHARWFLADLPLPEPELGRFRCAVAHNLLILGPLTHAEALDVAAKLIERAHESLGPLDEVTSVKNRCAWIRGATAGNRDEHGGDPRNPADMVPDWLVGLVAEREATVDRGELERGLPHLALTLQLRPDAADRVLATLVRLNGTLSAQARDDLFRLVHQEVGGRRGGEAAWTQLATALASIKKAKRPPLSRKIDAAIQQSREGWPQPPSADSGPKVKGLAKMEADFDEAVRLMRTVNADPGHPDSASRLQRARALLDEAVGYARRKGYPALPDLLISLGNAWKMPPDEDIERALQIYERVARQDLHPDQRAKLWKVQGDALRHRGRPEDLRQALVLLERSAKDRTGWMKAESLQNAAGVARIHPDLDDLQQIVRAVELLVEATRADAQHVEAALPTLLRLLGTWKAKAPTDQRPDQIRDELRRRYPHRSREVDRPSALPTSESMEHLTTGMSHATVKAYTDVATRLMPRETWEQLPSGLWAGMPPEVKAHYLRYRQEISLVGNVDAMIAALAAMPVSSTDLSAAPGAALARVRLLAELCRLGAARADEVRAASASARAAIETVDAVPAKAFLLREHARIWCPHDHADDPVRDFALAVELAREALDLECGEQEAVVTDTIELLARSLRYSPAGDLSANLAEAQRLYLRLHNEALAQGSADVAANALHLLADIEMHRADGDKDVRLGVVERYHEQAIALAPSQRQRARYTSSLAWVRTQAAWPLEGEQRLHQLQRALDTFEQVDETMLERHSLHSHLANRALCQAALVKMTEGRMAEITLWRERLDEIDRNRMPHHYATTQHNLAHALLSGNGITVTDFTEGLALCEEAAAVRTLEANPRHHWETALLAGESMLTLLNAAANGVIELPWPPREVWDRGVTWLRSAVEAARILGPGDELARAARGLLTLAHHARSTRQALDLGEEAWDAMAEAMPFLLLNRDAAQAEVSVALQAAFVTAHRLSLEGVQVASEGLTFVMEGRRAEMVLPWLLRAFTPLRRPVQARLGRPALVSLADWMDWLDALETRDPARLPGPLRRIRQCASGFLTGAADLQQTWRWLEARPGAVAVSVVLGHPLALALVLSRTESGSQRIQIFGLPIQPPPYDDEHVARTLTEATSPQSDAIGVHEAMAAWARSQVIDPLVRYLDRRPAAVLWCPGQTLRLISPAALWDDAAVAMSASPALSDLTGAPARRRSTVIVLADPVHGPLGLRGEGEVAATALHQAASTRGPVRVLASLAARHGAAVEIPGMLHGPASPVEVVEAARDHDIVVVIAHGEAPSPEEASLHLLDAEGREQRLDVSALAAHPDAFLGATVLLLACESGRLGGSFHAPGGIAGALISAGARQVIAPLWPVRLDVACKVAEAVLRGLADGTDAHEVLARLNVRESGGPSTTMGPPPSLAVQAGLAQLQQLAFVTWVG